MPSPKAMLTRARHRVPLLDHLVRAAQRYQADTGDRLAAAVTFYWFLSLFPILLLAVSLLGYAYGDAAREKVADALSGYLPGQLVETIGTTLETAKGKAGVIGLVGLLLSGLGWIDALREAIRTVWHQNVKAGNIVVRKLVDVVVLVGLFATIGASVLVTGLASTATGWVLEQLEVETTAGARLLTSLLALVLAFLADVALFAYLFLRLGRVTTPVRDVLQGAVFGAVGFLLLKVVGGWYVARTTTQGEATYGAFAVVVGLLLFLNLVSRFLLFTAAFVVTAPGDSDAAPSGTADPETARKAGIPARYADGDDDDPKSLQEDGAPTPLRAAVQGVADDGPDERGTRRRADGAADDGASRTGSALAVREPQVVEAHEVPGAPVARMAGQVGVAVAGIALLAVVLHALRTLWGVLRR